MTCGEFRDRVFDYLDGTLGDPREVEGHRASCPSCTELLRGIQANERVLSAARAPVAPADLWASIASRISKGRAAPFRRTRVAAGLAAAAALLLSLALATSGGKVKPRFDVVIREVDPEAGRAMSTLVPRYEDVDAATAMVDTMFR